MKLAKRTYYYKPKEKPSEDALVKRMEQICLEFPKYGYRRVTKQLQREGWTINHKKVARIMREKGWSCRPRKRKWIHTTDSNHNFRVYPNLLHHRTVDGINQVWMADITYIHIPWWALFIWRSFWTFIPEKPSDMPYHGIWIQSLPWVLCEWLLTNATHLRAVFIIAIVVCSMLPEIMSKSWNFISFKSA